MRGSGECTGTNHAALPLAPRRRPPRRPRPHRAVPSAAALGAGRDTTPRGEKGNVRLLNAEMRRDGARGGLRGPSRPAGQGARERWGPGAGPRSRWEPRLLPSLLQRPPRGLQGHGRALQQLPQICFPTGTTLISTPPGGATS